MGRNWVGRKSAARSAVTGLRNGPRLSALRGYVFRLPNPATEQCQVDVAAADHQPDALAAHEVTFRQQGGKRRGAFNQLYVSASGTASSFATASSSGLRQAAARRGIIRAHRWRRRSPGPGRIADPRPRPSARLPRAPFRNSAPCSTGRAPSARIAAFFSPLLPCGATIVTGTPPTRTGQRLPLIATRRRDDAAHPRTSRAGRST